MNTSEYDLALQQCFLGCAGGVSTGTNITLDFFNVTCTDDCYLLAKWSEPVDEPKTDIVMSLVFAGLLVMLSGLFSGLTLGLMSLDTIGLQILEEAGEPQERIHAKAILPIRKKGNLLLCTLLLGNTMVNALIAILLAGLTSGLLGGIISTLLIVILGEIIPQAACSRHGLVIGAYSIWIVRFFMLLFLPIAWPISLVLDKVLGKDLGTVYTQDELKKLIKIHVENPDAAMESRLTHQDHQLITGALEYKMKRVKEVMTDLDKCFMMELNTRLTFQIMLEIYKSGFTRIPIYKTTRPNVVGILFVKDLILVDPDDEVEVRAILSFHGDRSAGYVRRVSDNVTLDRVFKYFKTSFIHLLFACESEVSIEDLNEDASSGIHLDNYSRQPPKISGIISLEDVLEEVIQEEIIDETDNFVDVNAPGTAVIRRRQRRDLTQFMSLFEHKLKRQTRLSPPEIDAIAAYLSTNITIFKKLKNSMDTLKSLIKASEYVEVKEDLDWEQRKEKEHMERRKQRYGTTTGTLWSSDSDSDTGKPTKHRNLYRRGLTTDYMVLVLQGKVTIRAGVENFLSEIGPWTALGPTALTTDAYVPDFDAEVKADANSRLLIVRRVAYHAAMKQAQLYCPSSNYFAKGGEFDRGLIAGSSKTHLSRAGTGQVLNPTLEEKPMRDIESGDVSNDDARSDKGGRKTQSDAGQDFGRWMRESQRRNSRKSQRGSSDEEDERNRQEGSRSPEEEDRHRHYQNSDDEHNDEYLDEYLDDPSTHSQPRSRSTSLPAVADLAQTRSSAPRTWNLVDTINRSGGGSEFKGNDRGGNGDRGSGNDRGGNDRGNDRGGNDRGGNERGGNERGGNERGGNERGSETPKTVTRSGSGKKHERQPSRELARQKMEREREKRSSSSRDSTPTDPPQRAESGRDMRSMGENSVRRGQRESGAGQNSRLTENVNRHNSGSRDSTPTETSREPQERSRYNESKERRERMSEEKRRRDRDGGAQANYSNSALQVRHNALFYDDNSGSHRDRQQSFSSNNNRFRNSLTVSTDEYEDESSIHDIHLKGSE